MAQDFATEATLQQVLAVLLAIRDTVNKILANLEQC